MKLGPKCHPCSKIIFRLRQCLKTVDHYNFGKIFMWDTSDTSPCSQKFGCDFKTP